MSKHQFKNDINTLMKNVPKWSDTLIILQHLETLRIKGLRPPEQNIPLSSFLTLNRHPRLTVIRNKMHDKSLSVST